MSRRPLIGYATRSGVTSTGYAAPRFANNESYARAIADAGGAPLMIPSIADELRTTIMHPADANGRDYRAHEVRITEGTRLGRAVGRTEIRVNSLHHQAVRNVAPGFIAVAEAPDGVVEAIENPELPFAVGVQWHPEELYRADDSAANLFRAFVAAAVRHREEREQG